MPDETTPFPYTAYNRISISMGVNPEVVRRQMRHKNVSVTLKIYTQVRSEEIEASLPNRLNHQVSPRIERNSNVFEFKVRA
jgi:hypothetical protein